MFDMWNEEMPPEDRDNLIQKAAREIRKRKLQTPALMMLEMHKPLANVGAHSAIVFSPFIVPFFGFDVVNDYSRLFSSRDNIERLILELEKPDEAQVGEAEA